MWLENRSNLQSQNQKINHNWKPQNNRVANMLRYGGTKLNAVLVDLLTRIIDVHISPHHQTVSLGKPEKNLVPHPSGQSHPESHRGPICHVCISSGPRHPVSLQQLCPVSFFAVTLVEPRDGIVSYGRAITTLTIREGDVNITIAHTFVLHVIFEPEMKVKSVVVSGRGWIISEIEGWEVEVFYGACGFRSTKAKPHEKSCKTWGEDEAAAAPATPSSSSCAAVVCHVGQESGFPVGTMSNASTKRIKNDWDIWMGM